MEAKIKPEYEFEKAKVKQALSCLRELHKKNSENVDKPKLFDEAKDEPVTLHFTMKKIPELKSFQRIRVRLPHSYLKEDADVCLITGDLDKRDRKADIETTVLHYKDMLKKLDINNVTEVVPLRQLRTEYQSFESLRQLAGQYDVFLSDRIIHQCLSKLLGSTFIKCQKFPIQLDLRTKNLKHQVDQALSGTVFYVTGRGNMCGSQVAHLGLKDIQIIKNVRTAVETLAARLPGGWKNIDSLYLQTERSVSIPIYISFELQEDIEIKVPKPMEIDFISTVNEYIREQEEDSSSDSEEETETKEIGKKRLKVENDESADELKDLQNKVPKPKKRKIFPSLNEYIKKLKEDFLSDDEKETKRRKVESNSDKDSEESGDEVQEKSELRSTAKKIKGKKTKKKKIEKRESVANDDDEANEESAGEVQEKSELRSTEKKNQRNRQSNKKMAKANVEQAKKINKTKNKNKNEKSIVTKQKKKKNGKIYVT